MIIRKKPPKKLVKNYWGGSYYGHSHYGGSYFGSSGSESASTPSAVAGVGFGTAGGGSAEQSENISWRQVPFFDILTQRPSLLLSGKIISAQELLDGPTLVPQPVAREAALPGPRITTNLIRVVNRRITPNRIDPTRTGVLRRKFLAEIKRRFARLRGRIVNLVLVEDAFGLKPRNPFTVNTRWQFQTSPDKLKQFQQWLRGQFKDLKLSDAELWKQYAQQGFQRGIGRAFDDVNKGKPKKSMDFYAGTKQQFLSSSFIRPVAVEKVQLLAARSFEDMEGVTSEMATRMTRALADGLTTGDSPMDIADDLTDVIDVALPRAETIARTEIIRAHAEGQLDALEEMGVEEVGVAVEWSTAGDDRVCELCAPLEGIVLKLDEARGLLPRHPNCRCAWLPANVGEDDEEQKDTKKDIEDAFEESGLDEEVDVDRPTRNQFCPTGPGGGIDPTCGKGAGALSGTGTKQDPIHCGKDIKSAAKFLAQGLHIRLNQPEELSTLTDKIGKILRKAQEKGEKPPKIDMCKVSVPGTNLFCQETVGIPRIQMPQMRGQPVPGSIADGKPRVNKAGKVDVSADFIEHLKSKGIKAEQLEIRASHLRASQNEIDGARVLELVEGKSAKDLRERPIFVTRDNYVLDGHHHWAALTVIGAGKGKDYKVPVYRLDMDIGEGVREANAFAKHVGIAPKTVGTNQFCPTGPGGGVDPTCGKDGAGAGAGAGAAPKATASSMEKHQEGGKWKPERLALHTKIADKFFKGKTEVEHPTAYIMGGGPAAGKSTMVAKLDVDPNHVAVAPDDILPDLPEYREMHAAKDRNAGAFCHKESSDIGNQICERAIAGKYNIVIDGTGDGSVDSLVEHANNLRRNGRKVVANYVTVDVETAVSRNESRAKVTGRYVPEAAVRAIHQAVASIVPEAIKRGAFDDFTMWNNDGKHPVKIASAKGKQLTVHDEKLWRQFLDHGRSKSNNG